MYLQDGPSYGFIMQRWQASRGLVAMETHAQSLSSVQRGRVSEIALPSKNGSRRRQVGRKADAVCIRSKAASHEAAGIPPNLSVLVKAMLVRRSRLLEMLDNLLATRPFPGEAASRERAVCFGKEARLANH